MLWKVDSRVPETALVSARALSIRDRKSTRLNSSHGYISYAVFCLKKKNKPCERTSAQEAIARYQRGRGLVRAEHWQRPTARGSPLPRPYEFPPNTSVPLSDNFDP